MLTAEKSVLLHSRSK